MFVEQMKNYQEMERIWGNLPPQTTNNVNNLAVKKILTDLNPKITFIKNFADNTLIPKRKGLVDSIEFLKAIASQRVFNEPDFNSLQNTLTDLKRENESINGADVYVAREQLRDLKKQKSVMINYENVK
jgi:hypothetical protein